MLTSDIPGFPALPAVFNRSAHIPYLLRKNQRGEWTCPRSHTEAEPDLAALLGSTSDDQAAGWQVGGRHVEGTWKGNQRVDQ